MSDSAEQTDAKLLGELLAVMHADGGHYAAEHGKTKATEDAIVKYYGMVLKIDALSVAPAPIAGGLSDAQIIEIARATKSAEPGRDGYILPVAFARAIIAAHSAQQAPAYWQWREKSEPWQKCFIFEHEVHATTPNSEVRCLFVARNVVAGDQQPNHPNGLRDSVIEEKS